jgi:hypothetical protein
MSRAAHPTADLPFVDNPVETFGLPTQLRDPNSNPSDSMPGLTGLAGILMRNTLILTEQIKDNRAAGLDDYHAVIEATVQRTRPVILAALAAVLAFIPLTHSVFWGSMAYTLIGGTAVGTALILLFFPALYAAWFRIRPTADEVPAPSASDERTNLRSATAPEHGSAVEEDGSHSWPRLLIPAE